MLAVSQNQLAAYYMGIPVRQLNGLVWGLAAAVAAIAGLLLAPMSFVHANMASSTKSLSSRRDCGFGSLSRSDRRRLISAWWNRCQAFTCRSVSKTYPPMCGAVDVDDQAKRIVR